MTSSSSAAVLLHLARPSRRTSRAYEQRSYAGEGQAHAFSERHFTQEPVSFSRGLESWQRYARPAKCDRPASGCAGETPPAFRHLVPMNLDLGLAFI